MAVSQATLNAINANLNGLEAMAGQNLTGAQIMARIAGAARTHARLMGQAENEIRTAMAPFVAREYLRAGYITEAVNRRMTNTFARLSTGIRALDTQMQAALTAWRNAAQFLVDIGQ